MKKGHSKNRQRSKGFSSLKQRRARSNTKKHGVVRKVEQNNFKKGAFWKRLIEAIQLADFLIDKVSRLIKWLHELL